MLTYNQAYYELVNKLRSLYDEREATAIAHEVLQFITGLDKIRRLMDKNLQLTESQQVQFDSMLAALLKCKPLQYVLGHAWFMNREYMVNEQVLIPRPETEELVQWIIDEWKNEKTTFSILDIGTGSGCIPISLKLALPTANISSWDVSSGAINVAKENAKALGASIEFSELDFLQESEWAKLGTYDIIVSNPPYITISEKDDLHSNVTDYEPSLALFVSNSDPLQFYKAIAQFGLYHLNPGGDIYCELHRDYAEKAKNLFEERGYKNVEMRKDIHGNWRMLKAG